MNLIDEQEIVSFALSPESPAMVASNTRNHFKWFGLTLLPYDEAFREEFLSLYIPHFAYAGDAVRLEPLVGKYRAGILAIVRARPGAPSEIIGFSAFLPLTDYGVRLIEFDLFNGADLQPEALAENFRDAAALYWWATVAEGLAFRALPLVDLALAQPPLWNKPVYATAGSPRGLNAMLRLGFSPLAGAPGVGSIVVRGIQSSPEERRVL